MFAAQTRPWWILFIVAVVSFIPDIAHYYVGEEAIFPIVSQEMWEQGTWLKQYLYGQDQQHNPLFNWLIMPLAALAGWEHVLTVARILTISFTLASALTLAWLVQRLYRDRAFAAFTATAYLCMADLLLYHGWLSYVDPLFALLIFAAIATLWVGVHEQRRSIILLSGVLITLAFLAKAMTAYIFYGGALFTLLFVREQRRFLLDPRNLLVLAVTFCGLFLWYAAIPDGAAQQARMFAEMTNKLDRPPFTEYVGRLASFPLEVLFWLSPLPLLAIYLRLRKRHVSETSQTERVLFLTALAIALLNFLPYWISPSGGMRYLMPMYPLFALVAARVVWRSGDAALLLAKRWLVGMLVFKFVAALVLIPYYQGHFRGQNYDEAAADILAIAQGAPLYTTDVSSAGLNVTAYVNKRHLPASALQWPPKEWSEGFVIARSADPALGSVYKRYQLGGDELYLLCRGASCTRQ